MVINNQIGKGLKKQQKKEEEHVHQHDIIYNPEDHENLENQVHQNID
jgi:hypothetical protein